MNTISVTGVDQHGSTFERLRSAAGLSVEHSIPAVRKYKYPIVFIHGMWCTGETWLPYLKAFSAASFECFAPTNRGRWDSIQVENLGKVSINDFIADGCNFIRELDQEVILIDHSMGVLIGANVAAKCPGFVKAHVSLTSAPPRGMRMGFKAMLRMPKYLWEMCRKKPLELSPADAKVLLLNNVPQERHKELLAGMCAESGTAAMEITLHRFGVKRLHCPSLHIGARLDTITPKQRGVAKRLGADFAEVTSGHMVMYDPNADSTFKTINTWLAKKGLTEKELVRSVT